MDEFILENCKYLNNATRLANHFHTSCELIYIKRGLIKIQIDDKNYTVGDNKIIVISNLEKHETTVLSEDYERYFIIFSQNKLERYIDSPQLISIFKNRPETFNHCFDAPENTEQIFLSIIKENLQRDTFSEDIIGMKVKMMLMDLYRIQPFPFTNTNIQRQIYSIQKHISDHFRDDLKIKDLASKFFINQYYLSHSFKRLTGYSPKKYLLMNRLSYSKQLLIHSHLPIGEIALQSGFSDSNSFIRNFKQEYNMTPNEYRKNQYIL